MKYFIFTFILVLFSTSLLSQNPPDTLWTRTFGGSDIDQATTVQQTIDGGYIVAGYVGSYGAGGGDLWLIKTDANGNEEWSQTFGGNYTDGAESIQLTTDGGYILAGYTASYGAGNYDFWLIKTDSDGNEEWNQTFGGSNVDWAQSVQQTIDGGFVIAGGTYSFGSGEKDVWIIKTDANGIEIWNQTFGGIYNEGAESVQQTSDGGYIVAGYTASYGAGDTDFWLIKTDSDGNEEWSQTFGGSYTDRAESIQQTTDGGYIITGYTASYGAGNNDFWLIKTDSSGNEEWNQTFGGNYTDGAESIQLTTDGGYILAGETLSYGTGGGDIWLIKTDISGNLVWDKTLGGIESERAYSIKQTTDGGFIIAGYSASYGSGSRDFWLIKLECEFYADFSAEPTSGYASLDVIFSDESSGYPITWHWDFNNDGIIDSYNQNPTFTYTQSGIYSVALTVSDGTEENTKVKEDYINVLEPINADFDATPTSGYIPLEVNFTDLSSGYPTTWLWDFDNDGFIDSNEQNPIYIYDEVGVYTVSLTVSDGNSEDTEVKEDYITVISTGVQNEIIPFKTQLYQNNPNPFNPVTNIQFDIKENESGILSIFNLKGQLIESHQFEFGKHNYLWDSSNQASGVYFYKLKAGDYKKVRKMLLIK